ncbi:protein-tyrosine-phosphatase [Nonomuraea phyllanthi]|uniref:Protein-tyrosine-phosphatase n=1 Tax=Nonomuraea phyllanthi TaxID=2219224 RepID=A0A5C4WUW8_9ACTN|nr:tyrosine-protein phosphatase [Nonomuraea phyllanthi]KAB8196481.1 protein-tyrosine-phosphatase [Nonomuraea phyllanthi]QFY13803.1 protein-tyrosine-phosphatase [Nonomuraea phyllanthi]
MIRHIEFAKLRNFRDIGGYATQDGRTVRWQRLYRADSLGWLAGDDLTTFRTLRVRTVIDLRHGFEVEERGRVPEAEGQFYQNLPIEGRRWSLSPYDERIGVARYLADRYLEVTEDGVGNLRIALETIAQAANAPVVIHCAAGKDRTGVLAALVLSLAGVSEDDIVADYALTGLATEHFIADWRERHPDSPMWPGFGLAPAEAMRFFLTDLTARHGSVETYVTRILQVSPATIAEMRAHLLTEPISKG